MSQGLRSVLVLVVGAAAVLLAADRLVSAPGFRLPKDFIEYWAAARIVLRGADPYHPDNLLIEQRLVEPKRSEAVMMWNPPPALVLYMPLALVPVRWASLLWVATQVAAVLLACDWLWRTYFAGRRWIALLLGASFVGTWWLVAYGQNTGFLLLGLAGFQYFTFRQQPLAAGACAALTALKPHLLAGFGVLFLADAITRSGRQALLAGVAVIAIALAGVVLLNPHVLGQFLAAVQNPGPGAVPLSAWTLPAPSYWLRKAIDPNRFGLQFLPTLTLCAALVIWRFRSGKNWNWQRALPGVVAASVLCTPYGGWIFDLPVLLVPVVAVAARIVARERWKLFVIFVLGLMVVNVGSFATPGALHGYWWVAPAIVGWCLIGYGCSSLSAR